MSRAAFLGKLREVAPELLPFVRLFYGSPSTFCWWDELYALGQHDALQQASDALHPDDTPVAFLDDLYVITSPSRARAALDETVRVQPRQDPGSTGDRGIGRGCVAKHVDHASRHFRMLFWN